MTSITGTDPYHGVSSTCKPLRAEYLIRVAAPRGPADQLLRLYRWGRHVAIREGPFEKFTVSTLVGCLKVAGCARACDTQDGGD